MLVPDLEAPSSAFSFLHGNRNKHIPAVWQRAPGERRESCDGVKRSNEVQTGVSWQRRTALDPSHFVWLWEDPAFIITQFTTWRMSNMWWDADLLESLEIVQRSVRKSRAAVTLSLHGSSAPLSSNLNCNTLKPPKNIKSALLTRTCGPLSFTRLETSCIDLQLLLERKTFHCKRRIYEPGRIRTPERRLPTASFIRRTKEAGRLPAETPSQLSTRTPSGENSSWNVQL